MDARVDAEDVRETGGEAGRGGGRCDERELPCTHAEPRREQRRGAADGVTDDRVNLSAEAIDHGEERACVLDDRGATERSVAVARRIERWYNVKVTLADSELEKYSFRATFQDDSLEDILKFLAMTSPIRYQISPRELLSDGTFRKAEVTIYKKNK